MSEINPYQPPTTDGVAENPDVPNPPWRYRFIAGSSSSIGTLLAVSGGLGSMGALLGFLTSEQPAAQMAIYLVGSLMLMMSGIGLIYAGILWYNLRAGRRSAGA